MISRRGFLEGALAALALAPCAHARPGKVRGCCILPARAAAFDVAGNAPAPAEPDLDGLFASLTLDSGHGEAFEKALGSLLVMMSATFRVTPDFAFFDDRASPNALAVNRGWTAGREGTVAFGLNLLRQHLFLDPQGASAAAIAAHEFGHIFQYKSGFYDAIDRSGLPQHAPELHADYLAGAFLRRLVSERPEFPVIRVGQAWEAMGVSDFSNPGTHGTAKARLESIQAGYAEAGAHEGRDATRAAADGMRHLRRTL